MSTQLIPIRNLSSITGSQFAKDNMNNNHIIIDQNIINEALNGNIPEFLRKFVPITVNEKNDSLTYLVMPDVLSIGSDSDFIRIPMSAPAAIQIADKYNCTLPTKKMCDQIWKAATIKLTPLPKGPPYDNSMLSMDTYIKHNDKINNQMIGKSNLELVTGHKKDVIIDKELLTKTDRVGIYGWFYPNGKAIQGPIPNCTSHELYRYADYSHGIRLIAQQVILNGKLTNIFDVLNDKDHCNLISEQGPFDASRIYK